MRFKNTVIPGCGRPDGRLPLLLLHRSSVLCNNGLETNHVHENACCDDALPFAPARAARGPELLLDTCVYIDVLQRRAPEELKSLLATRL